MNTSAGGLVYLVGAGPGDPGLITLRGVECLRRADVVIHDFLLNPALLAYAPQAEIINAAQPLERHPRPLQQITDLMIAKARQGKVVVRLKGGDPLVFGRGGEEALALTEAGIRFRIVPGVTSATAVPTYAGIPITQRGVASSLAVMAGHNIDNAAHLDWPHIAHGADTLLFLMGIESLPYIVERLLTAGRAPDTPVGIVERGTHPGQKTVVGTLADIVAKAAGIQPPATIIVGEVVKLREKLRWFDREDLYPLFGLRVWNTQPGLEAEVSARLTERGAEVMDFATVAAGPPSDSGPLEAALGRLRQHISPPPYNVVCFASAEAVSAFFDRLFQLGGDARALGGLRLWSLDSAATHVLRTYGLAADRTLAGGDLDGQLGNMAGRRMLLLGAESAETERANTLQVLGAEVERVAAYALRPAAPNAPMLEMLTKEEIHAALFFSPEALHGLAHMLAGRPLAEAVANMTTVCAGADTAQAAYALGVRVDIVAETLSTDTLVEVLVQWRAKLRGD